MKCIYGVLLILLPILTKAQTIITVAGNGTIGSLGDGGPATAAELNEAHVAVIDINHNVYIGDEYSNRIRKVNTSGIITSFAGTGVSGFSGDGGPATAAQLGNVRAIRIDPIGNIYFADDHNGRIRKIDTAGIITTIAGHVSGGGFGGDGGPATAAVLNLPADFAMDRAGNIYIVDELNSRIRKVDTSGIINTIAGTGVSGFSGDGGAATAAQFYQPFGINVDAHGNIYVSDFYNYRIRKIDTSGIITTFAGMGTPGFSGDGGPATAAQMNGPVKIEFDLSGDLYFADGFNHRVRKINSYGVITTVAGDGTDGYSGDGGIATAAALSYPYGLFSSVANDLYITDRGNNTVRKIKGVSPITGAATLCVGSVTALSDTTAGGTWSSSNTAIATVSSTGIVSGVAVGIVSISYIVASNYYVTKAITVYPLPDPITGNTTPCWHSTDTLADATTGGTWSSNNTAIGTFGAAPGVLFTGLGGAVTITYTTLLGCYDTMTVNVDALCAVKVPLVLADKADIILYPNPVNTELTITYTDKITDVVISNLPGQTVYLNNYNRKDVHIDVADLPAGIYFVKVNGSMVRKFVKQ